MPSCQSIRYSSRALGWTFKIADMTARAFSCFLNKVNALSNNQRLSDRVDTEI